MKKIQSPFFSVLSIVTVITTTGITALARDNAAADLTSSPGLASSQKIELAQAAGPNSTESAQPFSPSSYAAQAIVLAQTMTTAQIKTPGPAADGDADDRFNANEWDFSAFGVYSDQAGGKWGVGAAGTYYFTEQFGVGAVTYWTEAGGTVFDNLAAEGYFRLPLMKVVAPYLVGSVGHQFDRDYWFETIGGGVDFRAFERISAFSDIQYRISNNDSKSANGAILRIGARFKF
jgi:hypothetical protein